MPEVVTWTEVTRGDTTCVDATSSLGSGGIAQLHGMPIRWKWWAAIERGDRTGGYGHGTAMSKARAKEAVERWLT